MNNDNVEYIVIGIEWKGWRWYIPIEDNSNHDNIDDGNDDWYQFSMNLYVIFHFLHV